MNIIHERGKLRVLVVQVVDGAHGCIKAPDVLRVHDEEGGVFDHDVSNPLVLGGARPQFHPLF